MTAEEWASDSSGVPGDPYFAAMTGPPEATYGVTGMTLREGQVTASMTLDTRHVESGHPALGALGVLVDDALGFATLAHRPAGTWSVSTELRIDLLRPLPPVGHTLRVSARPLSWDPAGGIASGEITGADGAPVAIGMQRSRFVRNLPDALPEAVAFSATTSGRLLDSLPSASLSRPDGSTELRMLAGPSVINSLRNLHGGVSFTAATLAAESELASRHSSLALVSAHICYGRPTPAGSEVVFTTTVQHVGRSFAAIDVVSCVAGRACTFTRVTAEASSDSDSTGR